MFQQIKHLTEEIEQVRDASSQREEEMTKEFQTAATDLANELTRAAQEEMNQKDQLKSEVSRLVAVIERVDFHENLKLRTDYNDWLL